MYTTLSKKLTAGGGSLKTSLTTSKANENAKTAANRIQFSAGTITPTETMDMTLSNSNAMDMTPGEAQVTRAEAKRESVVNKRKKCSNTKARLMYGAGSKSSKGKVGKGAGSGKAKNTKGKKSTKQSSSGGRQSSKKKNSKTAKKKTTSRKTKTKTSKGGKKKPANKSAKKTGKSANRK